MMDIKAQLQKLYEQYESELNSYAWESEEDRWIELVFCFLLQCSEQEPELIRSTVAMLQNLSLTDVDAMLHIDNLTHENHIVFAYVLKQYGFSDDAINQACSLLAHTANVIQLNYGGKIQLFLRHYGELMRDELVSSFDNTFLDRSQMAYAISMWLQNVLSLPISLQNDAVISFCQKNNVNPKELWQAADELNLNLTLVDDLLELHQITQEEE